jgi:glutaredoxin
MSEKTASLYRMVTDEHVCPYGLKSKDLLERKGFRVDDHQLESREETEAFMQKRGVETTPQTFIGDVRIGGFDDLQDYFGIETGSPDETTYRPVIAVFGMALAMALAISWAAAGTLLPVRSFEWFIAVSMCILALLKLQDLEGFSFRFITYDLLAMRWLRYAYIYPFGEALAGVLMLAGALLWIAAPVALFIGTVGAVSVAKAVYVDRRELKCACVGGGGNVPLGFISLTENLMMMLMGVWMLVK